MFEKILRFLKSYRGQYFLKKSGLIVIYPLLMFHCFHKILLFSFAELDKYKQHIVNTDTHLIGHNTFYKIALL